MDKNLDILIEEALRAYLASGVEDQVDYQKFYLYSIVTHSTAIEGSTVTEIENELLLIQSLLDTRDNNDSTITQDVMLRHHIVNLNRTVREYQESIMKDK